MAIVDTINSMYENVGEVYDTITNVDLPTNKNIENIPSTIRKSYLDIMNNGIDTIYDNWEKVNGTGTSLTLNNTEEAPMTIEYKGNTSQGENPTPTYPQDIHIVSGDNYINVCGKNLFDYNKITTSSNYINNYDGTFTRNSNGSNITINVDNASVPYDTFSLLAGTYSVSFDITTTSAVTINSWFLCTRQNGTGSNLAKSIGVQIPANTTTHIKAENYVVPNNAEKVGFAGYLSASTGVVISNIQVEKGSTATTYEEYKGASYEINLGVDNLVNPSLYNMGGSYNVVSFNEGEVISSSITGYAGVRIALGQDINLKTNDEIYVRLKIKSDVAGDVFNTIQLMNSSNAVITTTDTKVLAPTMTTEYQEYIMKFVLGTDDTLNKLFIQHKGSSNNTFIIKDIQVSYTNGSYTPYGKAIELCKIGTYQDRIFKSSEKNLFKEWISGTINIQTGEITSVARNITDYIEVKPNTNYTIWRENTGFATYFVEYNENKGFIREQHISSATTTGTFTTSATTKYVILYQYTNYSPTNKAMFNIGSTALPYEPYGKDWYLNKQIGKLVLDGTQNITLASGTPRRFNATYTTLGIDNVKSGTNATETQANYRMCDHFTYTSGQTIWGNYYLHNNWLVILDSDSVIADANDLKTWLGNNNTNIYYVHETPTYEKITGELLNQLEAIKKSYENQTNINQENNDLPFELEVGALEKY